MDDSIIKTTINTFEIFISYAFLCYFDDVNILGTESVKAIMIQSNSIAILVFTKTKKIRQFYYCAEILNIINSVYISF